jgi:predicted RNA-binding Zn-ribbon protein involved in translation (DUF1610 family)
MANQTGSRLPPTTQGSIEQVPCPHCGKPNDLRELESQQLLDTGHEIICDHCGRLFDIVGIKHVKVVVVRASRNQPRRAEPEAAAATTIGAGVLQRLLGKR